MFMLLLELVLATQVNVLNPLMKAVAHLLDLFCKPDVTSHGCISRTHAFKTSAPSHPHKDSALPVRRHILDRHMAPRQFDPKTTVHTMQFCFPDTHNRFSSHV